MKLVVYTVSSALSILFSGSKYAAQPESINCWHSWTSESES